MKQREIKFRIWSKKDKLFITNNLHYIYLISSSGVLNEYDSIYDMGELDVKDYVIQQFTGLKDKNGKEIYEGDILYSYYDKQNIIVFFKDGKFQVKQYKKPSWTNDLDVCIWCVKVTGNIFENPELINKKKS